jgi:hypothetical protein
MVGRGKVSFPNKKFLCDLGVEKADGCFVSEVAFIVNNSVSAVPLGPSEVMDCSKNSEEEQFRLPIGTLGSEVSLKVGNP